MLFFSRLKFPFFFLFWLFTSGLASASESGYAVAGSFKSLSNAQAMAVSISGWLENSGIPGKVEIRDGPSGSGNWSSSHVAISNKLMPDVPPTAGC